MKKGNPWGLYDVYGNIFELCYEWTRNKSDLPSDFLSVTDVPSGPAKSAFQIVRGGSYHDETSGGGGRIAGGEPYSHVGFRVVMTPVAVKAVPRKREAPKESSAPAQPAEAPSRSSSRPSSS